MMDKLKPPWACWQLTVETLDLEVFKLRFFTEQVSKVSTEQVDQVSLEQVSKDSTGQVGKVSTEQVDKTSTAKCAVCKVYFSAQPNKLKPILNFQKYYPI